MRLPGRLMLIGLIMALMLGAMLGCGPRTYTIKMAVEHTSVGAAKAQAIEIIESAYFIDYQRLHAMVYDDQGREVTTGKVSFATSTPETVKIEPYYDSDRIVYLRIDNDAVKKTTITVTFIPDEGEPIIESVDFMVAKTLFDIPPGSGVDFESGEIVSVGGDMILTDASVTVIDEEHQDINATWSFPNGYMTVPYTLGDDIGIMFAEYEIWPQEGDCAPGQYTMANAMDEALTTMLVIKTSQGNYIKLLITGGATYYDGSEWTVIGQDVFYQSIDPPTE
jgi:hypothetical protein